MFKLLLAALLISMPLTSFADEADDQLTKEESLLSGDAKKANYVDTLKTKYTLTDEQIKSMQDQGMNNQQMTMAAQLSKSSEKPLEDVLKMRNEQKMGWGKIAKELGVHPGEIGKGISSMRHDLNKERREDRAEKRAEKREKQKERHEAKRETRKGKKE
jgi:hypothetical protein